MQELDLTLALAMTTLVEALTQASMPDQILAIPSMPASSTPQL